jgi:eukaryotic-like serine/threonine-protein kinase
LRLGRATPLAEQQGLRRFGRYTLLADLAAGGSAQVHVAQKDGAAEVCVLKKLRLELRKSATAGRRLYREAHVAAYLQHENIARVLDAGIEVDTFYLAVEFVPGEELHQLLGLLSEHKRRLPPEMALRIIVDVLTGLDYAHNAKNPSGTALELVHRDLSPRNVMLGFGGEVKIIDFGAARGKIDDFKSLPGTIIGTPRYIAPEQVLGQTVDRRCDLYSVAALLFEMLTGHPVVPRGNHSEVLAAVVAQSPPRLNKLEPGLPKVLDEIIAKGLEKNPNLRWQSAQDLRAALLDVARSFELTPREEIGRLMRRLFTEQHKWVTDLLGIARVRHAETKNQASSSNAAGRPTMEPPAAKPRATSRTAVDRPLVNVRSFHETKPDSNEKHEDNTVSEPGLDPADLIETAVDDDTMPVELVNEIESAMRNTVPVPPRKPSLTRIEPSRRKKKKSVIPEPLTTMPVLSEEVGGIGHADRTIPNGVAREARASLPPRTRNWLILCWLFASLLLLAFTIVTRAHS